METLITKNAKSEMDLAINKIADGLEELFGIMKENKIDVDRIDFMKHIATVIDSGLNISHFHLSGKSETYEKWIEKCVEICEDETVTVDFILVDGSKFSQEATYNLATNVLQWNLDELPETNFRDISSVSFQREPDDEGDRLNVCKECLEQIVGPKDEECPECKKQNTFQKFCRNSLDRLNFWTIF